MDEPLSEAESFADIIQRARFVGELGEPDRNRHSQARAKVGGAGSEEAQRVVRHELGASLTRRGFDRVAEEAAQQDE